MDWEEKYRRREVFWNKGEPSLPMRQYLGRHPVRGRALVPGCGHGHEVAKEFFRNQELTDFLVLCAKAGADNRVGALPPAAPKAQATTSPIWFSIATMGQKKVHTRLTRSLAATMRELAALKRSTSRRSCAKAFTTRTPGMVSERIEVMSSQAR